MLNTIATLASIVLFATHPVVSLQDRIINEAEAIAAFNLATNPTTKLAAAEAGEILAENPDDLHVLVLATNLGAEEARKRNRKHVDLSLQHGLKAIAIIEANNSVRKAELGQLYRQTAILYLSLSNTEEAKGRLKKASMLHPDDPTNFALLGRVINAEYLEQMKAYEAMPEGQAKQDQLRKLEAVLDTIIDAYARAAGLATGRAEYRALLQQVIPDLTSYYRYRNNQSTKGLRQLIDKYRK